MIHTVFSHMTNDELVSAADTSRLWHDAEKCAFISELASRVSVLQEALALYLKTRPDGNRDIDNAEE